MKTSTAEVFDGIPQRRAPRHPCGIADAAPLPKSGIAPGDRARHRGAAVVAERGELRDPPRIIGAPPTLNPTAGHALAPRGATAGTGDHAET